MARIPIHVLDVPAEENWAAVNSYLGMRRGDQNQITQHFRNLLERHLMSHQFRIEVRPWARIDVRRVYIPPIPRPPPNPSEYRTLRQAILNLIHHPAPPFVAEIQAENVAQNDLPEDAMLPNPFVAEIQGENVAQNDLPEDAMLPNPFVAEIQAENVAQNDLPEDAMLPNPFVAEIQGENVAQNDLPEDAMLPNPFVAEIQAENVAQNDLPEGFYGMVLTNPEEFFASIQDAMHSPPESKSDGVEGDHTLDLGVQAVPVAEQLAARKIPIPVHVAAVRDSAAVATFDSMTPEQRLGMSQVLRGQLEGHLRSEGFVIEICPWLEEGRRRRYRAPSDKYLVMENLEQAILHLLGPDMDEMIVTMHSDPGFVNEANPLEAAEGITGGNLLGAAAAEVGADVAGGFSPLGDIAQQPTLSPSENERCKKMRMDTYDGMGMRDIGFCYDEDAFPALSKSGFREDASSSGT